LRPHGPGLARRHLDRRTPWRPVKDYCHAAGIDPGGRGLDIHGLRETAIDDAIRNGTTMHEARELAEHADIRTAEVDFIRKEEDAEVAARRIRIRVTGSGSQGRGTGSHSTRSTGSSSGADEGQLVEGLLPAASMPPGLPRGKKKA
jgi:hypothetical protein